jgi:putative glycosyltransferase (TIGR04372 family)
MIGWLVNLINKYSNIHILMPRVAFGDRSEEILFGLMYCKKYNKSLFLIDQYIFFWPLKLKKSNNELLRLTSPYIKGNQDDFIHHLARFFISLSCLPFRLIWKIYGRAAKFMFPNKSSAELYNQFFARLAYPEYGYRSLFNASNEAKDPLNNLWTKKELVRLYNSDFKLELGKEINYDVIDKLGISRYPWFVCLHVREGSFRKNDTDFSRNTSIENNYQAIQLIIKKGGCVVRLGDHSMSKLTKMEGLIDYANSGYTSELLDLYLVKNCRFYIGTHSGPMLLACLFKKDIINTNSLSSVVTSCFTNKSILLRQNIYKGEKKVSVESTLKNLINIETKDFCHLNKDYSLEQNSSIQIYSAVSYYLDRITSSKFNLNQEEKKLFELYISKVQEFILHTNYYAKKLDDITHKKRLLTLIQLANGVLID